MIVAISSRVNLRCRAFAQISVTFSSVDAGIVQLGEDAFNRDAPNRTEGRDCGVVEGDDDAGARTDKLADRRKAERMIEGVADCRVEVVHGGEAATGPGAAAARDHASARRKVDVNRRITEGQRGLGHAAIVAHARCS